MTLSFVAGKPSKERNSQNGELVCFTLEGFVMRGLYGETCKMGTFVPPVMVPGHYHYHYHHYYYYYYYS